MLDIKQFNPGIKTVISIASIIFASILAFYLLVIYWPQSSPYESMEINIPKGVTLSEISNILKEEKILANPFWIKYLVLEKIEKEPCLIILVLQS